MNRFIRGTVVFAMLAALAAGSAFAQTRGLMERRVWYVNEQGKVAEALYWRIFLGDYDMKATRNIAGKGQVTFNVRQNFQFLSSGFIEGNGSGSEGRVHSLPGMRIRIDGAIETIRIDAIDYIFDYGTKVVLKDGRRGDFLIGGENNQDLEIRRFQLSEYRMVRGQFGEQELKEFQDRTPIIGIAFSREAAQKAAQEPVTPSEF